MAGPLRYVPQHDNTANIRETASGGVDLLVKNLQAIQQRKAREALLAERNSIMAGNVDRQRQSDINAQAQIDFENRLTEARELAKIKALEKTPTEAGPAVDPLTGLPQTTEEAAKPIPISDRTIKVKKPDGSELQIAAPSQEELLDTMRLTTDAQTQKQGSTVTLPDDPEKYGEYAGTEVPTSFATTLENNMNKTPPRDPVADHKAKRLFDIANPKADAADTGHSWVWEYGTGSDNPGRMVIRSNDAIRSAPDGTYAKKAPSGKASRLGSVMEIFGGPESMNPASLWNAAKAMNKGKEGGLGRVEGVAGTKFRIWTGDEPFSRAYQDQLAGFASQIAKEFGESGRLSDQDILRTVNLFPTPADTEEETDIKLNQIWRVLEYARSAGQPRPTDVIGVEKKGWTQSALPEEQGSPEILNTIGGAQYDDLPLGGVVQ